LNGHVDVVDASEEMWSTDPFEPVWDGDHLIGRGSADMKSQLAALVYSARYLKDEFEDELDGRLVVEIVSAEEDGGMGTATSALSNPYPFERDAAIVAEPTNLRLATATEGTLVLKLKISGLSAHSGTRWEGESVLPHFEEIRKKFEILEKDRHKSIEHPLYQDYQIRWPVNFGVVRAGTWPSMVPDELTADMRIGVAPSESHEEVETQFRQELRHITKNNSWLNNHPPKLEKFASNFPSAEISRAEPIVKTFQDSLQRLELKEDIIGLSFGADSAWYVEAGDIPSIVFGPGKIENAHIPDEKIQWSDVLTASKVYTNVAREFLGRS
jgi:acetylornithine deacetylase